MPETGPCDVRWGDTPDAEPCGRPGVVRVLGCVHEHLVRRYVCDRCLARVRRDDHQFVCSDCWRAVDSHECPVLDLANAAEATI